MVRIIKTIHNNQPKLLFQDTDNCNRKIIIIFLFKVPQLVVLASMEDNCIFSQSLLANSAISEVAVENCLVVAMQKWKNMLFCFSQDHLTFWFLMVLAVTPLNVLDVRCLRLKYALLATAIKMLQSVCCRMFMSHLQCLCTADFALTLF